MKKDYQISDCRVVEGCAAQYQITVYINPDKEEKRYLIEEMKVDEHTLSSALDPDELSRLEFEPNHIALIFKRPQNYSGKDQFLFKVGSTGVFLFKDRLVVVLSDDVPLFDGKQFSKVLSLNDLLLKLIYRSVNHFIEHLRIINMTVEELEAKSLQAIENKHLLNIFSLEKSLVYYFNAISSNGVLIEKLKNNAAKIGFTAEEMENLDDLIIENNQCTRQAEIYSSIFAELMDARTGIISNNLNIIMKTLTIITIIIMVPTFVVSAFSMNVKMPFNPQHPFTFWFIVSLATLSVLTIIMIWRYKRW